MRAPIHSEKHYVQMSLSTVATTTVVNTVLIDAVTVANKNTVSEVVEGALVKAIYIELWIQADSLAGTQVTALTKFQSGAAPFSAAQMAALGTTPGKKNTLFVSQGLASNDGVSGPIAIMRGWYKIPKSKQRFGLGDTLELQILAQGAADVDFCGFATYKEYT